MVKPYLEEFCGDVMMDGVAPSIGYADPISTKPLDSTPISSPLLSTTPSYVHTFHQSLGAIRGYNSSFDSYCAYLEYVPRKIMWSTFFDHTFDFYMAFSKFKRPLTLVPSSFVVPSYLTPF